MWSIRHRYNRVGRSGTTVVELTVAVAILSTVFAVLMPLFAGIRHSTEARWAGLEMVQNARVLNEHLGRHLAQTIRMTAVSAATEDRGWIEFEAGDGRVYRCGMRADGYIGFGPVGDAQTRKDARGEPAPLAVLAGPVEYLRFVCYQGGDLHTPTCEATGIRLVTWEAALRSAGSLTQGRIVTGASCLRATPAAEGPSATGGQP